MEFAGANESYYLPHQLLSWLGSSSVMVVLSAGPSDPTHADLRQKKSNDNTAMVAIF